MTIDELLDQILPASDNYNPAFAEEFHDLVTQACNDRINLMEADEEEFAERGEQFLASWGQFLGMFADDPRSLASLAAPAPGFSVSCGDFEDLVPQSVDTPTVYNALFN